MINTSRPVASLKRAGGGGTGDKQGGTEFEGGGVVSEVLRIRGGVVGEVLRIRRGGVGEVLRIRGGGVVGEVEGGSGRRGGTRRTAFSGGALTGGHSPGGTHRGLLSGGALNGKHSGGNIQRGGTPLQRGGHGPKMPPLGYGPEHITLLVSCCSLHDPQSFCSLFVTQLY